MWADAQTPTVAPRGGALLSQVARMSLEQLLGMLSQYVQALATCLMEMQGAPHGPESPSAPEPPLNERLRARDILLLHCTERSAVRQAYIGMGEKVSLHRCDVV